MSIWDAFGKGRYKGFSREAGQLLDKAVELAGGLGCKKADTGHLLWAMLQSDGGPAARFLAGKNISELEAAQYIFDELNGNEGILVASKIADRVGITRSVIVNALRKFESAGVIESRSSGMKGTYIKVLNDVVFDELKKMKH